VPMKASMESSIALRSPTMKFIAIAWFRVLRGVEWARAPLRVHAQAL
jgi:hypothetical protein